MALLDQLKLLVNLARIDGDMAAREKQYIITIGKAHGFPESSVSTLFYNSHQVVIPENLTDDEKFNYIFSLLHLMIIDERIYQEEIKFCSTVASKLGYSEELIFEFLTNMKSTTSNAEQNVLRDLLHRHFKK
ncbi:MAG: hypothetical protein ACKO96_18090 [Flammeovirgaceae bacterium]